jgi:phosphotransferase system HPr (HPr) family protein
MAAVMAAGMVAPLAMALATSVRPKLFTEPERENGKAAWLLGASFISEGAIPFAAADPFRVIASSVVGSAVTGAIAMATGVTSRAPHGGIWVLPLIGNFLMFVVALVIGVLVMAAIVLFLKQRDHSRGGRGLSRPRGTPTCQPHENPTRRTTLMAQRTVTIASSVGLHARPAALFVEAVNETGLEVEIGRPGDDAVDASSILGVMALGAKHGEEVVLTADGDGAEEALDGLVALLSRDLDAE